jgi:hypothetical protein
MWDTGAHSASEIATLKVFDIHDRFVTATSCDTSMGNTLRFLITHCLKKDTKNMVVEEKCLK